MVVITVVTITMTSACVYLPTKKCLIQIQTSSTAQSTEMPTIKESIVGSKMRAAMKLSFKINIFMNTIHVIIL